MLVSIYAAYLAISIAVTVWVGRTLHGNGRVFLVRNFRGNEPLADAVNHLLLVGFYLINFGFICLTLSCGDKPNTLEQGIEFLSVKQGTIILAIGVMHFFAMLVLTKCRDLAFIAPAPQQEEKWADGVKA